MPTLTPDEVRRIAALARLDLSDSEVDRLTIELAAILEYAAQVQRVDTRPAGDADTLGGTSESPSRPVLRPDNLVPSLPRKAILDDDTGFFTVPRVLGA